jgi:single-strand DNA-binding protein
VTIFNENLGRVAKNYLRKGSKVYLEGQLQTRKWTDQAGVEKFSTEVVLQNFRGELVLLDSREGGGGGARGGGGDYGDDFGGGPGGGTRTQSRPQPAAFDTDLDDDVPF